MRRADGAGPQSEMVKEIDARVGGSQGKRRRRYFSTLSPREIPKEIERKAAVICAVSLARPFDDACSVSFSRGRQNTRRQIDAMDVKSAFRTG